MKCPKMQSKSFSCMPLCYAVNMTMYRMGLIKTGRRRGQKMTGHRSQQKMTGHPNQQKATRNRRKQRTPGTKGQRRLVIQKGTKDREPRSNNTTEKRAQTHLRDERQTYRRRTKRKWILVARHAWTFENLSDFTKRILPLAVMFSCFAVFVPRFQYASYFVALICTTTLVLMSLVALLVTLLIEEGLFCRGGVCLTPV